jgi:hypothetical protein
MIYKENKEQIERVIENSFKVIQKVYEVQREGLTYKGDYTGSRIIFPLKSNDEVRISEQELRFIFIEQLNAEIQNSGWNVYYSVETPTQDRYIFSDGIKPRVDENGRSANFDLVIYNSAFKRVALIEFKANNPDKRDYEKDFVKLANCKETGEIRYFIQVIKNCNKGTIHSLSMKVSNKDIYRCWSLEGTEITKLI